LLAYDWWFSPCTPASSTTKTGRHDIAEILLKVALTTIKINQMKVYIIGNGGPDWVRLEGLKKKEK
jgi:hypothetical protein